MSEVEPSPRRQAAEARMFELTTIDRREILAGEPGFEPGLTESESVGLPLTYSPAAPR